MFITQATSSHAERDLFDLSSTRAICLKSAICGLDIARGDKCESVAFVHDYGKYAFPDT